MSQQDVDRLEREINQLKAYIRNVEGDNTMLSDEIKALTLKNRDVQREVTRLSDAINKEAKSPQVDVEHALPQSRIIKHIRFYFIA